MNSSSKKSFFNYLCDWFIAWFLSGTKRRKAELRKEPEVQALQSQIHNLFSTGESLTGLQVSNRLRERTGGRRDVALFLVYDCLEWLTEEGKLVSVTVPYKLGNEALTRKEYSLPE